MGALVAEVGVLEAALEQATVASQEDFEAGRVGAGLPLGLRHKYLPPQPVTPSWSLGGAGEVPRTKHSVYAFCQATL